MKIPGTLAVMALPGVTLFPGGMLPLSIFEPRYRKMLADALAGERMFAIGLAVSPGDDSGVCEVGGAGFVRVCVAGPDGTSRLILQGVSRVRFCEWLPGEPYRLARVEALRPESRTPLLAKSLRAEVVQLCARVLEGQEKNFGTLLDGAASDEVFTNFACASLVEDVVIGQKLMEELEVTRRLEILAAYLTSLKAAK